MNSCGYSSKDNRTRSTAHFPKLQNLFSIGVSLQVDNQITYLQNDIGKYSISMLQHTCKPLWTTVDRRQFTHDCRVVA